MISIKDWAIIAGIVGPVITGGWYVIHLDGRVAETSQQIRRHVAEQDEVALMQKKWALEERVQKDPGDMKAKQDLEMTNRLLMKNQEVQADLRKERQ